MNIGLVNEYFPPFAPGGAEWSMLALARELAKDHQVAVITPNYGAAPFEAIDGMRIYRFNVLGKLEPGQTTVRFRWLANPLFYLNSARQIERVAQQEQLHLIHAQNKYTLPGAWLAARWMSIPAFYTVRDVSMICPLGQCMIKYGFVPPDCGHWQRWRNDCRPTYLSNYFPDNLTSPRLNTTLAWLWVDTQIRRWFFRRVDGLTSVSQGILQVYERAGLIVGQDARTIYNIPPRLSPPSEPKVTALKEQLNLDNKKVVFYAGRFSLGKGTQDLVAAADLVVKEIPTSLFLFAGYGDLNVTGAHVRSLGQLSHEEVWQLYHLVDLVVVPSRQPEPLTRTGLEAMAAGRPLVGTNVGGTPELIQEGINGLLVAPGQPAELAQAIIRLLVDDNLRKRMGRASLNLIQTRFDATASLERLVEFYQEIVATHGE